MRPYAVILLALVLLLEGCASTERRRAARLANPAPCPNVFVLEQAARFIDFRGAEPALENVAFSGEIDDVTSSCRYYADVPIDAEVAFTMSIGRGPAAEEDTVMVEYFVAVTRTNRDVIAKETFQVPVTFKPGQSVVTLTEEIESIVIPRAKEATSGLNFEIAIGFVLTEEQFRWNRSGASLKFPEL
ncbi:hypothetical protein [Parvularcula lutaonensis]|uniref:Lipoprotein n=1 Tax=Parvularcula lutaonensis TaxID=491923 RepID=A0ABV7M923_9PROT|nr:hypothetical protein [Parvularcula lutaonensis]GGY44218.1 hypothetical protein GCM10007148_11390 [Parvularcula lutaonensis]